MICMYVCMYIYIYIYIYIFMYICIYSITCSLNGKVHAACRLEEWAQPLARFVSY